MDEVKQPMLLVWGDEDPFTPLRQGYGTYFAKDLVESRPRTELAVVNAGHCPHDDAPKEVRRFRALFVRRAAFARSRLCTRPRAPPHPLALCRLPCALSGRGAGQQGRFASGRGALLVSYV